MPRRPAPQAPLTRVRAAPGTGARPLARSRSSTRPPWTASTRIKKGAGKRRGDGVERVSRARGSVKETASTRIAGRGKASKTASTRISRARGKGKPCWACQESHWLGLGSRAAPEASSRARALWPGGISAFRVVGFLHWRAHGTWLFSSALLSHHDITRHSARRPCITRHARHARHAQPVP